VRYVLVFLAVLVIPSLLFLEGQHFMGGMRDFALRWVFNSPAYSILFPIVDRLPLKDAFTAIKDPLHLEPIAHFVYFHLYTDFVTRAILGLIAIVAILRARSPISAIAALLLCSPAIHPWYWIVIAPLAIRERSAWRWFALAAPCSYLLYAGANPWLVFALCYAVPIALILLSRRASSGAGSPAAAIPARTGRDTSPS
jgi:hypothetical protein